MTQPQPGRAGPAGTGVRVAVDAMGGDHGPSEVVPGALDRTEGSDIGPMVGDGQPGVALNQDGTRYFDYHHTPDDTLDKVDPAQLRQNVAAWTAVLAILSGGIEPSAEPKRQNRR